MMDAKNGEKITPNLYRVAWWDITSVDFVNCDVYAIDCGESVAIIDSGRGEPSYSKMRDNLEYWGLWNRVSLCLITHMHRDHAGGIESLRADGIKVWGNQRYLEYIQDPKASEYWNGKIPIIDKVLKDGECFTFGNVAFEAIDTPGHTSTCMSYIVQSNVGKYVFAGDMIMPNGMTGYTGSFDFNSIQLITSLYKMLQHDFSAILTGHYLASSQPEGFWLNDGKSHALATYQNGLEGQWNIQT